MHRRRLLASALLSLALLGSAPAQAGWLATRDMAMTLRERGRGAEAYAMVAGSGAASAAEQLDREFTAGFLALRVLMRADLATTHFQNMAILTARIRASDQPTARSTAGYWLGRSLQAQGRGAEARKLYETAALYRNTYYGLIAASQIGLSDTPTAVATVSQAYPDAALRWHDPRVSKELVLAVIKTESNFKATAQSGAGAKGAMQVMDGTARLVGRKSGVEIDTRMMATNFDYNVVVGSKIFGDLLEKFDGNVMLAAAGYNAGEGRPAEWLRRFGDPRAGRIDVVDWIELIPFRETRDYVKKVVSTYVTYMAMGRQAVAAPR
jgi:soluble lytic murein transglycosylase-like protein